MKNSMAVMVAALGVAFAACMTEPVADEPDLGASESALECAPTTDHERACADHVDNDCDGLVDYCDPDCRDDGGCLGCNVPDTQSCPRVISGP